MHKTIGLLQYVTALCFTKKCSSLEWERKNVRRIKKAGI